jgi:hypothetical protein
MSGLGLGVTTSMKSKPGAPPALGSLVFNPTPVFSTFTLSNANRTVTMTGAGGSTAAATTALTGKKVFAARLDANPGNFACIGIGVAPGFNAIGFDGLNSVANYFNSNIFLNSAAVGGGMPAWGLGSTEGVFFDAVAKLIWFTSDGTNWYGSTGPLTIGQVNSGVSGVSTATLTAGTLFPLIGSFGMAGHVWTLVNFPWTLPSGASQL